MIIRHQLQLSRVPVSLVVAILFACASAQELDEAGIKRRYELCKMNPGEIEQKLLGCDAIAARYQEIVDERWDKVHEARAIQAREDARREEEAQREIRPNFIFPAQRMNNPALEAEISRAFNEWLQDNRAGATILKVAIISEWHTRRHEVTGEIIGRTIWGGIAYRRADGGCSYDSTTFDQEFDGQRFGRTVVGAGILGTERGVEWGIDCARVTH